MSLGFSQLNDYAMLCVLGSVFKTAKYTKDTKKNTEHD